MASTQCTVRGRYLGGALYKAKPQQNGDLKYSACVALDSDAEKAKVDAIIEAAIEDKWEGKPPKGMEIHGPKMGDDEDYASYEHWFVNPKQKSEEGMNPPQVLKRKKGTTKTYEPTDDVYPGCYVALSLNAYAYDGNKQKGIKPGVSLGLRGVLFTGDGERLGGGFNENEFDEVDFDEDVYAGVSEDDIPDM